MLNALARKPVCATMELDMPTRRFPPPWSVEEQDACFVVTGRRREACTMAPAASIKLKAA
jgi:hypothetical protein